MSTLLGINCRLAVTLIFAVLAVTAYSQTTPRITEPVSPSDSVRFADSAHPLVRSAADEGRVDGKLSMERMMLVLKRSDQQEGSLQKLLVAQHDPASSSYHQWLTPEEFNARFGPNPQDLEKIVGWLTQRGFRVGQVAHGGQWIEFSGTAAQVENAFHTEMHAFEWNGKHFIANSSDIAIPRALSPAVHGVLSLHNFHAEPMHSEAVHVQRQNGVMVPSEPTDAASDPADINPNFTLSGGAIHFVAPGDFHRIYNELPLLQQGKDGSGVAIAIVARSNIALSDVQTFRSIFGLPASDPQIIVNGPDPGVYPGSGDLLEATLDVEWAGAAAPGATIRLVASAATYSTDGVDLSAAYIVDNRLAPIMSTSFGLCERFLMPAGNAFWNSLWQQASAEGITSFVSSGDNGVAGCDGMVQFYAPRGGLQVNGLASTPFNVAVGGTQFAEDGTADVFWEAKNRLDSSSARGYIPEAVWNQTCDPNTDSNHCFGTRAYFLYGSGGGASNCLNWDFLNNIPSCLSGYPKPVWQNAPGVPNDGARDLPDVSLNASGNHDGYIICVDGACQTRQENGVSVLYSGSTAGGTSVSAPAMAGIMAVVEQQHGQFQGQANYELYRLATVSDPSACNSSSLTDPAVGSDCIFYDTTTGDNGVPGIDGYKAAAGYDLATGLGTVNAASLVAHWNNLANSGTVTSLSTDSVSVQHGQPLDVHVAVSAASGSPTGDVTLRAGQYGFVGVYPLTNGAFAGPVNTLPGGSYNLTAHYSGDTTFTPSDSSPVALEVTPEPTSIEAQVLWINFVGGVAPLMEHGVPYGSNVFLDITPKGTSGLLNATGTVTILDGSTPIGTVPLNNKGTISVFLSDLLGRTLDIGGHDFVVKYSGDNSYAPSTSTQALKAKIFKATPFIYTRADASTITQGEPVVLTATVAGPPLGILPTGMLRFYDNGNAFAHQLELQPTGPLGAMATAIFTATGLAPGLHCFKAGYNGDEHYDNVDGDGFSTATRGDCVTVNAPAKAASVTSMVQSPAGTIAMGQETTYTVTVSPARNGEPVPTGTVTLIGVRGPLVNTVNGNSYVLTSPLVNASVSFTFKWGSSGPNPIRGQYSGDSNYDASTSVPFYTTVLPGTPQVTVSASASQVLSGQPVEVSVTVFGTQDPEFDIPSGSVQFYDALNGCAPVTLGATEPLIQGNGHFSTFVLQTTLPAGTHLITARYLGSNQWAPTSSSNAVTVVVTDTNAPAGVATGGCYSKH